MEYLEDTVKLWNEAIEYDRITVERFKHQVIYDSNFDPELFQLAFDNDKILVGFIFAIRRKVPYLTRGLEPERGWIVQIAVKKDYRNKGIGKQLLDIITNNFGNNGVKEITLSAYSPNYFTPGVDKRYIEGKNFFESNGYIHKNDAVSMSVDLFRHQINVEKLLDKQKEKGIYIKRFEDSYALNLLNFAQKEFGGGWTRNILLALESNNACDRIFIAVNKNDEIVGFVMRAIDGNDSRFGPIGVDEHYRSNGLGGCLLEVLLDDLIKRGIYYSFFLWTSGDNIKFYKNHEFNTYREYLLMRKKL